MFLSWSLLGPKSILILPWSSHDPNLVLTCRVGYIFPVAPLGDICGIRGTFVEVFYRKVPFWGIFEANFRFWYNSGFESCKYTKNVVLLLLFIIVFVIFVFLISGGAKFANAPPFWWGKYLNMMTSWEGMWQ